MVIRDGMEINIQNKLKQEIAWVREFLLLPTSVSRILVLKSEFHFPIHVII